MNLWPEIFFVFLPILFLLLDFMDRKLMEKIWTLLNAWNNTSPNHLCCRCHGDSCKRLDLCFSALLHLYISMIWVATFDSFLVWRTNMTPRTPKLFIWGFRCWDWWAIFLLLERCFIFADVSFECAGLELKLEEAQVSHNYEDIWTISKVLSLWRDGHTIWALF